MGTIQMSNNKTSTIESPFTSYTHLIYMYTFMNKFQITAIILLLSDIAHR